MQRRIVQTQAFHALVEIIPELLDYAHGGNREAHQGGMQAKFKQRMQTHTLADEYVVAIARWVAGALLLAAVWLIARWWR